MKYCPYCKETFDDSFCPECGARLVDTPSPSSESGMNLNLGDANAISGNINVDSHNVTNVIHERQKHLEEIHQEKVNAYKNLCEKAYSDGVITNDELRQLESLRLSLGLEPNEASTIREAVKALYTKQMRDELTPMARVAIEQAASMLKTGKTDLLKQSVPGLKAIAENNSNEEIQYYYYLIMAGLDPSKCIQDYETRASDNYWQTFWTFFAYQKEGMIDKAQSVMAAIEAWAQYPAANSIILAISSCVTCYYNNLLLSDYIGQAKALLKENLESRTILLNDLVSFLEGLTYLNSEKVAKIEKEYPFYFNTLFKRTAEVLHNTWIIPEGLDRITKEYAKRCYNQQKTVLLPESLVEIGEEVFYEQECLEKIYTHKCRDLHQIGTRAFDSCKGIEQIDIPASVKFINERAFANTKLVSVLLPVSLKEIGNGAFQNAKITDIQIPDSVTSIPENCFAGCTSLKSVKMSPNITLIGKRAFYDCRSLETICLPNSLEEIGKEAFCECNRLQSVDIPIELSRIDAAAFKGCTNLESVSDIEYSNVTKIEEEVFNGCDNLSDIDMTSISYIGKNAFKNCRMLDNVTLPSSLEYLDPLAFTGCDESLSEEIMDTVDFNVVEVILTGIKKKILISKKSTDFTSKRLNMLQNECGFDLAEANRILENLPYPIYKTQSLTKLMDLLTAIDKCRMVYELKYK